MKLETSNVMLWMCFFVFQQALLLDPTNEEVRKAVSKTNAEVMRLRQSMKLLWLFVIMKLEIPNCHCSDSWNCPFLIWWKTLVMPIYTAIIDWNSMSTLELSCNIFLYLLLQCTSPELPILTVMCSWPILSSWSTHWCHYWDHCYHTICTHKVKHFVQDIFFNFQTRVFKW